MNKYAGVISFAEKIDIKKIQDKNLLIEQSDDFTSIFVIWNTKLSSSEDLINSFEKIWKVDSYDFSISTEDKINIMNIDFEKDGIYESCVFEGPEIDFKTISSRFLDSFEVCSIREFIESETYNNRTIKVDFVY